MDERKHDFLCSFLYNRPAMPLIRNRGMMNMKGAGKIGRMMRSAFPDP